MTTVGYDGQSLMVGSRRIWLVSGSVHYARVPRAQWRDRIRAAKQAGLNCIDTFVFWNLHEPSPGRLIFEGDLDLRHFVELIGEEGMFCLLRPGPYIGDGWDGGGLPAWLGRVDDVALRQSNGPFQEACARYLGAVMQQVGDLQVRALTGGGQPQTGEGGGPIAMMQIENHWCCDPPSGSYLGELARYLREYGCTVPLFDNNQLWTQVEGVVSAWTGGGDLTADLRQLRLIQSQAPRLVVEHHPVDADTWGQPANVPLSPDDLLMRLASIVAVGAQYNVHPFHGGTHFGFHGGAVVGREPGQAGWVTTGNDRGAPLTESGGQGPLFGATKKISTFASQFGSLLAHLDPAFHHACISPDAASGQDTAVVHQRGAHGEVVFLFRRTTRGATCHDVLLASGLNLTVSLGRDPVAWFVVNANLGGEAILSHTNLRPWAWINRKMLVLFGPAGTQGVVSLNDSVLNVTVPKGRSPVIEHHEGLVVAVLNESQIDNAFVHPDGLALEARGFDEQDNPVAAPGCAKAWLIRCSDGGRVGHNAGVGRKLVKIPRLSRWQYAALDGLVAGSSDEYRAIDGPADLSQLEADFGYGWYRLALPAAARGKKAVMPGIADRVHVFQRGRQVGILGVGPDAQDPMAGFRTADEQVFLADNLGRFSDGWSLGQCKGVFRHAYTAAPLKPQGVKVTDGQAPNLFEMSGFLAYTHHGEAPQARIWTAKVRPKGRSPVVVDVDGLLSRAALTVNGRLVWAYDPIQSAGTSRFILDVGDQLKGGGNELSLALFGDEATGAVDPRLRTGRAWPKEVRLYQCTANLSSRGRWSFAKWRLPHPDEFGPVPTRKVGLPGWFECRFKAGTGYGPLWVEPNGMTKGQIYLNGHNVGRYYVATASGKAVGAQSRYYLPEAWLDPGQDNHLLLFDEGGARPTRCRLVAG